MELVKRLCTTPLTLFRIDLAVTRHSVLGAWGSSPPECMLVRLMSVFIPPCVSSQGEEDGGRGPAEAAAVRDGAHCENV